MSKYEEQLKSAKWKELAAQVKKRDGYKCTKCGSRKKLQVHHKIYVEGRKAWEYNADYLQTLCDECHVRVHLKCDIKSFVTNDKWIINDSKVKKKRKPRQKVEHYDIAEDKSIADKRKRLEKEGKLPEQKYFQMKLEKTEKSYKLKKKDKKGKRSKPAYKQ